MFWRCHEQLSRPSSTTLQPHQPPSSSPALKALSLWTVCLEVIALTSLKSSPCMSVGALQGVPARLDPTPICSNLFSCLRHRGCRYTHGSWGPCSQARGPEVRGSPALTWQHPPAAGPATPAHVPPPPPWLYAAPKVLAGCRHQVCSAGRSPTCTSDELLEKETTVSTNSSSISNEWLIVFKPVHCIFWERIYDLPKNFLLK